jgi:hypothetical protein
MFDRMSLIHSADDSSKKLRDEEFLMEPFLRIQMRLTFHTYSIRLAPNINLLESEKLGFFHEFMLLCYLKNLYFASICVLPSRITYFVCLYLYAKSTQLSEAPF